MRHGLYDRRFVLDFFIGDERVIVDWTHERANHAPQALFLIHIWLPAGEVLAAPVAGAAEGKVVVERQFFEGREIREVTLSLEASMLTSMTAESGLEPLKELCDASGSGRDQLLLRHNS